MNMNATGTWLAVTTGRHVKESPTTHIGVFPTLVWRLLKILMLKHPSVLLSGFDTRFYSTKEMLEHVTREVIVAVVNIATQAPTFHRTRAAGTPSIVQTPNM